MGYKSAKEVYQAKLRERQISEGNAERAAGAEPVRTWGAVMPAYCYTGLCPAAELRKAPERGGEAVGQEYISPILRDEGRDTGFKKAD